MYTPANYGTPNGLPAFSAPNPPQLTPIAGSTTSSLPEPSVTTMLGRQEGAVTSSQTPKKQQQSTVVRSPEDRLYMSFHNLPDILEALTMALLADRPDSEDAVEEYMLAWLLNLNSLVERFFKYNVLSYAHPSATPGGPPEICHQVIFAAMPKGPTSKSIKAAKLNAALGCPHCISKVAAALPSINLFSLTGLVARDATVTSQSEAVVVYEGKSFSTCSPCSVNNNVPIGVGGGLVLRPLMGRPTIPSSTSPAQASSSSPQQPDNKSLTSTSTITTSNTDMTANWPKHRFMPVFATPPNEQHLNHIKKPTLLHNGVPFSGSRVKALKEHVQQAKALHLAEMTTHEEIPKHSPPAPIATLNGCGISDTATSHDLLQALLSRETDKDMRDLLKMVQALREETSACSSQSMSALALKPPREGASSSRDQDRSEENDAFASGEVEGGSLMSLPSNETGGLSNLTATTAPPSKKMKPAVCQPAPQPKYCPRRAAVEALRSVVNVGLSTDAFNEPFTPSRVLHNNADGPPRSLRSHKGHTSYAVATSRGGSRRGTGVHTRSGKSLAASINSAFAGGGARRQSKGSFTVSKGSPDTSDTPPNTSILSPSKHRQPVISTHLRANGSSGAHFMNSASDDMSHSPMVAPISQERRRIGVSEAPMLMDDFDGFTLEEVPKSQEEEEQVRACVNKSTLFSAFEDHEREKVVRVMKRVTFNAGAEVLTQGKPGNDTFYLLISGQVEVIKDKKVVTDLGPGEYFGELELMHAQKCAATIKCITPLATYALSKDNYRHIVLNATMEKRKMFLEQIENVGFFAHLPMYDKTKLAEALTKQTFKAGDHLIRKGEKVEKMFMILSGHVRVVGRDKITGAPEDIIILGPGDVLGELEFLFAHDAVADVLAADQVVEVAKLLKPHFELIMPEVEIENLKAIVAKGNYSHYMANANENVKKDILKAEQTLETKKLRSLNNTVGSSLNPLNGSVRSPLDNGLRGGVMVAGDSSLFGGGSYSNYGLANDGEILFSLNTHDLLRSSGTSVNQDVVARFPAVAMATHNLAVVCLQEDGTVLYWNPFIANLTQYAASDAVNSSIFSFVTNEAHQRDLRDTIKEAYKYTGNWEDFHESTAFAPKLIELTQSSGLYKIQLSIQIVPACSPQPDKCPEIFLMIGQERKRKVPSRAFDQIGLITDSIKPALSLLLHEAESLISPFEHKNKSNTSEAITVQVPTDTVKNFRKGFHECRKLMNQLGPLATGTDVTERWHAVRLGILMNRFITQLSEVTQKRGNRLKVVIDDLAPSEEEVFLDAIQLSQAIGYLANSCNRFTTNGNITISVDVVDVFGEKLSKSKLGRYQAATYPLNRDENNSIGSHGDTATKNSDRIVAATSNTNVSELFGTMSTSNDQLSECDGPLSAPPHPPAAVPLVAEESNLASFLCPPSTFPNGGNHPSGSKLLPNAEVGSHGGDLSNKNGHLSHASSTTSHTTAGFGHSLASHQQFPLHSPMSATGNSFCTADSNPNLANKRLRFTVSDDGAGIDKLTMVKIRRALKMSNKEVSMARGGRSNVSNGGPSSPLASSNSRRRSTKASDLRDGVKGLGLLQVSNMVKDMAGVFEIKNRDEDETAGEGRGTTFEITIPLVIAEKDDTATGTDPNSPTIEKEAKRNFTTVLVENSTIHRNVICQLLWGRRHAVIPANTWKDVLRLLDEGNCDLLIIDPDSLEDFDNGMSLLAAATQKNLNVSSVEGHHTTINPMEVLASYASKLAIVVTSENFADTSQANVMTNGVTALPKPCPQALLHFVVVQAEQKMRSIREDAQKIAKVRETFGATNRGEVKVLRLLGRGAFGEVHEVEDVLTKGHMAMKSLTCRNQANMDEMKNEIQAMTALKHENIVHYFYCQRIDDVRLQIFMELAAGGSIAEKIAATNGAGLPLATITAYLHDILAGLAYIHSLGYVHCDMKPANILLDDVNRCKLGDFGTARQLEPGKLEYEMKGTPQYMAPEVIAADSTEHQGYDHKADIWSLGVLVMEMATGKTPYSHVEGAQGMGVMKYVTDTAEVGEHVDMSPLFGCSPLVFEFVKDCLEPNPEKRPTAKELLSYALVTEGGSAQQANKLLRKARLLHILNQFVAFQDPDDITSGESSSYDSEEYSDGDSAGFFDSNSEDDEISGKDHVGDDEDTNNVLAEISGPSDLGGSVLLGGTRSNNSTTLKSPRKVVLSKRAVQEMSKTDFFSSSDEDDEDANDNTASDTKKATNTTMLGANFPVIGDDDDMPYRFASGRDNFKKSAPLDNDSFSLPTGSPLPFASCNAATTPPGILTQSKYIDRNAQDMTVSVSDLGGSNSRAVSPTLLNSCGGLPSIRRSRSTASSTPSIRQAVINIIGADESSASECSPAMSAGNIDHASPTLSVFIPRLVSSDNQSSCAGSRGASPQPSPRVGMSGETLHFGTTKDGPPSRSQSFSRANRTASNLRKRVGSPSGAMVRSGSMRRQQRQQQMADEYHSVFQRSISGAVDEDFSVDRLQAENSDVKSFKGNGPLVPSMGGSAKTEDSSSYTASSMGPNRVINNMTPGPRGEEEESLIPTSSLVKSLRGMGVPPRGCNPNHRLSSDGLVAGEGSTQTSQQEGFAMLKRGGITSPAVDALHFATTPVSPRDDLPGAKR